MSEPWDGVHEEVMKAAMSEVKPNRSHAKPCGEKGIKIGQLMAVVLVLVWVCSDANKDGGGLLSPQNDLIICGCVFGALMVCYAIGYGMGTVLDRFNQPPK